MKKILMLAIFCLSACSTIEVTPPTPFTTGNVVAPPSGCTVLRAKDPKADC